MPYTVLVSFQTGGQGLQGVDFHPVSVLLVAERISRPQSVSPDPTSHILLML